MCKVICLWYYIYLWIHLILFITRILECGLGLSHLHNHIRFQVTEILFYNEEWRGRGVSIIWTRKQIGPINFHRRFPVNVNYIHSDLQKVNLCYFIFLAANIGGSTTDRSDRGGRISVKLSFERRNNLLICNQRCSIHHNPQRGWCEPMKIRKEQPSRQYVRHSALETPVSCILIIHID